MALLKDTEREQLRQLVKACLLEISELKMELKKCQNKAKSSNNFNELDIKLIKKSQKIDELEKVAEEKDEKIIEIMGILDEKDVELEELRKIKRHFDALTARPKKDLTSFQSQVYQLLTTDKNDSKDHYTYITSIGFKELSFDNFNSILRNLERKGYFKSSKNGDGVIWEKIEK